jgi:hypothetical protein
MMVGRVGAAVSSFESSSEVHAPTQRGIFRHHASAVKGRAHGLVLVHLGPVARDAEAPAVPLVFLACGQVAVGRWQADLCLHERRRDEARVQQSARRDGFLQTIEGGEVRGAEGRPFAHDARTGKRVRGTRRVTVVGGFWVCILVDAALACRRGVRIGATGHDCRQHWSALSHGDSARGIGGSPACLCRVLRIRGVGTLQGRNSVAALLGAGSGRRTCLGRPAPVAALSGDEVGI